MPGDINGTTVVTRDRRPETPTAFGEVARIFLTIENNILNNQKHAPKYQSFLNYYGMPENDYQEPEERLKHEMMQLGHFLVQEQTGNPGGTDEFLFQQQDFLFNNNIVFENSTWQVSPVYVEAPDWKQTALDIITFQKGVGERRDNTKKYLNSRQFPDSALGDYLHIALSGITKKLNIKRPQDINL